MTTRRWRPVAGGLLILSASAARAQDTDRALDIQRRIAALEAQFAELKAFVEATPATDLRD